MQERQQFHQAYLCNRYGGCNSGHSSRLDFTDPQHCSKYFPSTLENRVIKSSHEFVSHKKMWMGNMMLWQYWKWSSLQFLWTFVRQQNFTLNVWMSNLIMCSRTIIIKPTVSLWFFYPKKWDQPWLINNGVGLTLSILLEIACTMAWSLNIWWNRSLLTLQKIPSPSSSAGLCVPTNQ